MINTNKTKSTEESLELLSELQLEQFADREKLLNRLAKLVQRGAIAQRRNETITETMVRSINDKPWSEIENMICDLEAE